MSVLSSLPWCVLRETTRESWEVEEAALRGGGANRFTSGDAGSQAWCRRRAMHRHPRLQTRRRWPVGKLDVSTRPPPPTHLLIDRLGNPALTYLWKTPTAQEDDEEARSARQRAHLTVEAATRAVDANFFFLPLSPLRLSGLLANLFGFIFPFLSVLLGFVHSRPGVLLFILFFIFEQGPWILCDHAS